MPEDFPNFEPPTPFPPWQRRAVPELPGYESSEPAPTRPVTSEPNVPELDFDQSTVSESDGPETDFDDGPETDDDGDDDGDDDDQDDDFESEDDGYDSGYDAGSEFESDDEESDDDDSEEEDQDFESDDEDLRALELCLNKLHLLMLEVEKYEARIAVRTEPENDVSHHSDVDPAPGGFVIDVSHLNVHNNELPPRSAAAVSPLAGQQNEPVPCAISFSWWLTGRKHAEHRVPLFFYVLACDVVAVVAGAALYATFQAAARALLCEPGTITRPVNDFPVAWLAYAPLVTVVSVALDAVVARQCERVLRVRGCRVWAALPVFRLRRRWAGARRQFVNVSFSLFAVQTLVYAAVRSFCITACC
ncbi:hypothetical protein BBO_06995 [Beauveria brongniartii RCEF 3172]|uniref:Uncharacterized protein n=1 Tax=Beauveria brongniartii RCEF 3172 TaxID=1081107 RepID=A0A162J308_9HYPO|nr:hypothetical protein BBO_06995 [Beauveria brongniartii RCEF 3172]